MRQGKPTAAQLWTQSRDENMIRKCEQFARFTNPSLMVDPLQTGTREIEHDFQSVGSVLLNNLASKLVSALFPTGVPFFKNTVTKALQEAAAERSVDDQQLASMLAQVDREAAERLFLNGALAKLTRMIKLLIITGNVLTYRDPETSKFVVWSVRSFAVRRTSAGEYRCVVLKQLFKFDELPENVRADYEAKNPGRMKPDASVDYYTVIEKQPGAVNPRVVVWNEVDGIRCGPESSYPEHLSPWILATWNLDDGQHYGTGLVEDFTGDFAKLSLVSEQLGLYELEALSILNLVDESAGGVIDEYQEADTGDYVRGKTAAITSYERGDYNKIAAIRESLGEVIQRLGQAFMYTGNTRNAERVTAEEIRGLAREAEAALGGVYSLLAESLQTPLAYLTMAEVSPALLQGLVSKMYKPSIITGTQALSRAVAVQNLLAATQEAAAIAPALLQLDSRIDPVKLMNMLYNSRSVDTTLLFKDPEVLAAEAKAKEDAARQQQDAASALLVQNGAQVSDTINQLG
ncbi:putative head-tail connector protein [Pseudomonas phage MR6]|uniref:Putative head-to-tail connector protein n=1 Tax=Pseudomonas phage MR5 TaxID=2711172 RepID=A0A6M3TCQ9_9CAUD|nr:putative head-to-tail connector protein [Pseudomonas phage MR5]QJD54865.1 putative head-tail connector protein [Pseudomonas phage MR6]QJD54925.1 putative head-tail connector protein [Pseudomonas phage MR7]QJD54985.1 putative head-tail connector protein [Pseudomonas phage MR8]QJD55042.1 putative head-tail connector protein [Pseudomonas phage MR12]QJD55345.1 putative head-to-tail connector protein [Pseudomonas phage MR18]QJF74609.1 putative head-to-tail connector protein [Pseudomonas phage M